VRIVAFHEQLSTTIAIGQKQTRNCSSAFGALSSKPPKHHSTASANPSRSSKS
jgi:hypothetical protein